MHHPVTWHGINYTGTQITQWDFQNKGNSGWTGTSSFVLEVPLRNLRPSVIYSVPCDRIVQRAYCTPLGPITITTNNNDNDNDSDSQSHTDSHSDSDSNDDSDLSNRPQVSMVYLQVNALSERIIKIYLHEFTNNERENSIPHEVAECGIENFEFIVSERVQVNPDNSRAMSALTFLLLKLNTLQTKIVKL